MNKRTLSLIATIPVLALLAAAFIYWQGPERTIQRAEAVTLQSITEETESRLMLLYIAGLHEEDEKEFIGGSYTIKSTDGSQAIQFTNGDYEAFDKSTAFIWGDLVNDTHNSKDDAENASRAFIIDTESVTEIATNGDTPNTVSIAPSREYIVYTTGPKEYCVASLSTTTIGTCYLLSNELLENSAYFEGQIAEIEWDNSTDKNTIIIRIRDTENHTEIESHIEGNPPVRVQNELERFEYNLETNELTRVDLSEKVDTKERDTKYRTHGNVDGLQLIHANWEDAIYLYKNGKKAKLFDAPFGGEMPIFDIYLFK